MIAAGFAIAGVVLTLMIKAPTKDGAAAPATAK